MKVLTASAAKHVAARLPGRFTLAFLFASLALGGCTRYVGVDSDLGPQAYYRTGFPVSDVSEALERVTASVVMIFVQRTYETYLFAEDNAPTALDLRRPGGDVRVLAIDTLSSNETIASSGVVLASMPRRVTILATDHATHFPDTIIDYFDADESGGGGLDPDQRAIERISIKAQQANTVSGARYVDPFDVLARNPGEDLALIGVTFTNDVDAGDRPASRLTSGDPGRLSLGSLVYVIGHPAGRQMVTHGIVGDRGPNSSFLTDGLWNEGMSGAPIMAVRGEGDALEWVGIALAASARTEHRLVAADAAERTQDPRRPYGGPIYLQPVQQIRYGIIFSVPVTTIHRFLDEHRSLTNDRGYPLPSF